MVEGWLTPRAMEQADMDALITAWCEAAQRAREAGFDVMEPHAAHAICCIPFLSPLHGIAAMTLMAADLAGRARFPLAVARALRETWPAHLPLFKRLSAETESRTGLEIADTTGWRSS